MNTASKKPETIYEFLDDFIELILLSSVSLITIFEPIFRYGKFINPGMQFHNILLGVVEILGSILMINLSKSSEEISSERKKYLIVGFRILTILGAYILITGIFC